MNDSSNQVKISRNYNTILDDDSNNQKNKPNVIEDVTVISGKETLNKTQKNDNNNQDTNKNDSEDVSEVLD